MLAITYEDAKIITFILFQVLTEYKGRSSDDLEMLAACERILNTYFAAELTAIANELKQSAGSN